jgi:hypothetical protein
LQKEESQSQCEKAKMLMSRYLHPFDHEQCLSVLSCI